MANVLSKFPMLILDNGLTVVNYGSPHSYHFQTGEVLKACSDYVARNTMLDSNHINRVKVIVDNAGTNRQVVIPSDKIKNWKEYVCTNHPELKNCKMWLDVFINYIIPEEMSDELLKIAEMDIIDIILVPYPLMDCWEVESYMYREISGKMIDGVAEYYNKYQYVLQKMRTCKLEDRITKVIYSDRFCASTETHKSSIMIKENNTNNSIFTENIK